jgi:hypothetical protein
MAEHVHPGEKCPACARRVPHPRKDSTPQSKVVAYRTPLNEAKSHAEVLEAAAQHVGSYGRPYWQFWTYTYALASLLQDPNAKDSLNRT